MATIATIAGAVIGAGGSYLSAKEANKGSKNAGRVEMETTRDPWAPSRDYRINLMEEAFNRAKAPAQTFDQWRGGGAAPTPGGKGKGKGKGKNGGGGGGKGKPGAGFNGVSGETSTIRDAMIDRAQAGNPLYGVAEDYVGRTLQGDDQNGYRRETFDAMRNVGDEDLERMKDMLFAELEGGAGGGFGGGGGGGRSGGGGGSSSSGPGEGPVGAAGYIKKILDGQYLDEGNPYLEERVKAVMDDVSRTFNEKVVPGVNSQFAGAGRMGSGFHADALARSTGEYGRGLTKEAGALRFDDYNARMGDLMQALGYGTQLDMNAADNAASMASSSAGAGAAADEMALRRQGMLLDALGGAIGEGVGLSKFGLSGMGQLSGDFSDDQQFALGAVPGITGLSLRDWSAAGDLSLGADQNQGQYLLGQQQIAAQRAAAGAANRLARDRFMFDVFRDERGYPMTNIAAGTDIINALSGPYGTTVERGIDGRGQSPSTVSPWGQAIAGGVAGAMQGYQWGNQYGGGNYSGDGRGSGVAPADPRAPYMGGR